MDGSALSWRYRFLFSMYFGFVALVTACYGVLNVHAKTPWVTGDWLINYQGGFVRRGLPGEIALQVGHAMRLSPVYIVLFLQMLTYVAMFYSVWRLLARTNWSPWVLVLLVSPATLAFQLLDPVAGFRKEEILLGGLGLLIVLMLERAPADRWIVLYLSVFGTVCVLSHESLILYLPYVFAAVAIGLDSVPRAAKICAVPLALASACGYLVKLHLGNLVVAKQICSSLGYTVTTPLPPMCAGAILYLRNSQDYARQNTIEVSRAFHSPALYAVDTLLALIPVAMACAALWRYSRTRRDLLVLAGAALISGGLSTLLFLYGMDWGRWIYIHVFCIFLLLLFIDDRRQQNPATAGPPPCLPASRNRRLAVILLVAVYAMGWDLPHEPHFQPRLGYFGMIKSLL